MVQDIETLLIGLLSDALQVPVLDTVPSNYKKDHDFVSVERVGGAKVNEVIDHPMLALQAWAPTKLAAAKLAYRADDAMLSFVSNPHISEVSRNSFYSYPDEYGNARYQIVFNLTTI